MRAPSLVLQQLIIDLLSGGDPDLLANDPGTPALSKKKKNKEALRKKLADIKLCK